MSYLPLLSSTGLLTIATGIVYFKPAVGVAYEELGIVEPFSLKPEFEDLEIYDSRTGVRVLADMQTTKTTLKLTATLKMLTGRVRALSLASTLAYENQASATGATKTFMGIAVGDTLDLGKLSISNPVFVDTHTAPVSWTLNTHYKIDAEAGLARILAIPDGSNANILATFDHAEILPAAKQPRIGIANNPDLRGALIIRGTNTVGVKTLTKLPSVRFRPSGERPYMTEEYVTCEVEGAVLPDASQAAGEELGYEQTL